MNLISNYLFWKRVCRKIYKEYAHQRHLKPHVSLILSIKYVSCR